MHTAFEFQKSMFFVEIDGHPADRDDLLDWGPMDRLGVVIDRPVGALGAGLLTLMVITAFYDQPKLKRRTKLIYPEIYLFHVGGPWGSFSGFDFWPSHKEVFLGDERGEVFGALNHCGITHLAVPDRAGGDIEQRYWEIQPAFERLKLCLLYGVDGQVPDPDVTISTTALDLFSNYDAVIDLDNYLTTIADKPNMVPPHLRSTDVERSITLRYLATRQSEKFTGDPVHAASRNRIAQARQTGKLEEQYRRITAEEAAAKLG